MAVVQAKSDSKSASIAKKKLVTGEFRVSFPSVFKAKAFNDKQEAKFSVVMLFPKSVDLSRPAAGQTVSLKHAAFNAAVEKWGPKEEWPKNLRMPFRDGDEKSDTMGYAGHIFVTASSKNQPGLVDQGRRPILNEAQFYAGCYARAELIAFAYDQMGNKGVGFSLQNLQKLRDGDAFSGRKAAEDVFESVEDTSEDESSYDKPETDLGF